MMECIVVVIGAISAIVLGISILYDGYRNGGESSHLKPWQAVLAGIYFLVCGVVLLTLLGHYGSALFS